MNEFLNFSHQALNLLDNQIHDKIQGSFIDNFIHELQDYLELQESNELLDNLPKNANLHFAKFEGNYAVCFDYSSKTLYNVPKSYIKGSTPEAGDAIRFVASKDFRVDSTGIPAKANNIDELISECSYANSSTKLNVLPEYYKISEITSDFTFCKNLTTNKQESIPIDDVPKNAKNGDTLVYKNGEFKIKR